MRVILNSDVLFGDYVRDGLPSAIRVLVTACEQQGHIVTLPQTALWEVERDQAKRAAEHRSKLAEAYRVLELHGIAFVTASPEQAVPAPDVIALFREVSPATEVSEPTETDFQDAHRRACFHLPPKPPHTKSDQMRDLVIWVSALRLAVADGGAVLVSKDVVHMNVAGSQEALVSGLTRVKTPEDALEVLEVKTPAGSLFAALVAPAWTALREAGVPVSDQPMLLSVVGAKFVQGAAGPAEATADIKFASPTAEPVEATFTYRVEADGQVVVTARPRGSGSSQWQVAQVTLEHAPTSIDPDVSESLADLDELLGG